VLTAGLMASAMSLLAGLALGRPGAMRAGLMLLMLTPVVRVVILTVGLFVRRDWLFALVSLFVLSVLLSGIAMALNLRNDVKALRALIP